MVFLFVLLICMIGSLQGFFEILMRRFPGRFGLGAAFCTWLSGLLCAFGFFLYIVQGMAEGQLLHGGGDYQHPPEAIRNARAVYFFLAGGLAGSVAYTLRALSSLSSPRSLISGFEPLFLLAHLYVIGVSIDHIVFWSHDEAGILSSEIARSVGVDCNSDYLLIQENGDAVDWRCPNSVALGNLLKDPLVPWPSYSTGHSVEMKVELDKLRDSAKWSGTSKP